MTDPDPYVCQHCGTRYVVPTLARECRCTKETR